VSNTWVFSGRTPPGKLIADTSLVLEREYQQVPPVNGAGAQTIIKSRKPLEVELTYFLDAPWQGTEATTNAQTIKNRSEMLDFAMNHCKIAAKGFARPNKLIVQNWRWTDLGGGPAVLISFTPPRLDVKTGLRAVLKFIEYFPPKPFLPAKPEDAVLPDTSEKPKDALEQLLAKTLEEAKS
jgi:hypothetical protein